MQGKMILIGLLVAALSALIPLTARSDDMLSVWLEGEIMHISREAYLIGVVAAEMPASYEMEALKAQAVAARTRTLKPCQTHPGADVCAVSACCQGYLTDEAQSARWGPDAGNYRARIQEAVNATRGIIITFGHEPIEVLYHAVSGGHTEDVEQVFREALPYLRGVVSPGEEGASGFETSQTFTQGMLTAAFPGEKPPIYPEVTGRTANGRVTEVRVGGHSMTGRLFRSALGLKSTNFVLEHCGDTLVIHQKGYGHGVGMSQAGANAMAKAGSTFAEILLHYYTGVELSLLLE